MEIRKADWPEFHEVARLWGCLAREMRQDEPTETDLRDYFNHITYKVYAEKDHPFLLLVMMDEGKVCGYIQAQGTRYLYGKPGVSALIDHAYVLPEYRGKGWFKKMAGMVEKWAESIGAVRVEAHVEPMRQGAWERVGLEVETIFMSKGL